jgi:two-component system phosphate regulon sensor histidine kinase PhoR
VQVRVSWKRGLAFLGLLLAVLWAVDLSTGGALRRAASHSSFWFAALAILIFGISTRFFLTRTSSRRVETLKQFSRRVAQADFRPVELDYSGDELDDLATAFNEAAARLNVTFQSLTGERNRSSAILGSMEEGVAVMDSSERLVFCNPAFSAILGVDLKRAEGRPLVEVIRQAELFEILRSALRTREVVRSEVNLDIVQPGTFALAAVPLPPIAGAREPGVPADPEAKPLGVVMVLHDITELRRLERVRRDFVANVSHEFRTPLTAIQGFAETLLAGALQDSENNRRFLEIIREQSVCLARLTDDLLKLARIEAGKLELEMVSMSALELIQPCVEAARVDATRKKITLHVDVAPQFPSLWGDLHGLREVLQNLLDNALQYTPPGGSVTVRANLQGDSAILSVQDTGIGIPQSDRERIFERFYRVDSARSRDSGRTGLGLSIARHIVEAHNGRIWVEGEVGSGSAFRFTLSLAPSTGRNLS